MADSESDFERSSPLAESETGVSPFLQQLAHATPVSNALGAVVLPTPLRGLVGEAASKDRADVPVAGSVIAGRYRLESVLGAGGMGVVYAAHHLQTEKPVALKWLSISRGQRGSRDRAQALARFAREARAAGRIRRTRTWSTSTTRAAMSRRRSW